VQNAGIVTKHLSEDFSLPTIHCLMNTVETYCKMELFLMRKIHVDNLDSVLIKFLSDAYTSLSTIYHHCWLDDPTTFWPWKPQSSHACMIILSHLFLKKYVKN